MRAYTALTVLMLAVLSEGWPVILGITDNTVIEGGNVTAVCPFSSSGTKKSLCKDEWCTKGNILVQTTENTATNGNYSIRFDEETYKMFVTMQNMQLSDSGYYWCVLVTETSDSISQEKMNIIIDVVRAEDIRPKNNHHSAQGSVIVPLIAAGILILAID